MPPFALSLDLMCQVLPIVEVDPTTANVSIQNAGTLLAMVGLALAYLWGVAAATFLEPSYV